MDLCAVLRWEELPQESIRNIHTLWSPGGIQRGQIPSISISHISAKIFCVVFQMKSTLFFELSRVIFGGG
jgi:hypothetical protein